MDLSALEYTREHYNRHAGQYADTQQALAARAAGPGAPLKKFHNQIKRQLIQRYAKGVPRLLDLCCGRGGDIWKWIDADVQYVKGIDLSEGEVEEAQKRWEEAQQRRPGLALQCEFVATPDLGLKEWREAEQFDVVTCMFAIHYFFVSEQALRQFLHNVSINLREGGYFIGTVPDGKRVNECIRGGCVYDAPMLHIQAHWQGQPQCFGSPYICAIGDTVTSGAVGSMGSFEYLVYFNVLERVAAKYGLRLVTDYGDPALDRLFEQSDVRKGFKHFSPRFPLDSEPSLTQASALNVAFVFQKTSGKPVQLGAEQQQQQQERGVRKHEDDGQEEERAGKRGRVEDASGSGGSSGPAAGGSQAGVAEPGQQGSGQGGGARQQYKKPTARRRVNEEALQ